MAQELEIVNPPKGLACSLYAHHSRVHRACKTTRAAGERLSLLKNSLVPHLVTVITASLARWANLPPCRCGGSRRRNKLAHRHPESTTADLPAMCRSQSNGAVLLDQSNRQRQGR